jgi:hypothetical protein
MLSDSCSEFIQQFREAGQTLDDDARHYSSPPFEYGEEIDALRRSCTQITKDPFHPEAGAHLLRLALSIMSYHDAAPGNPNEEKLEAEMFDLARPPSPSEIAIDSVQFSRILLFGAAALAGVVCGRAMYGILREPGRVG